MSVKAMVTPMPVQMLAMYLGWRYGEIWGRYGEIWGDMGEIWGDMGEI